MQKIIFGGKKHGSMKKDNGRQAARRCDTLRVSKIENETLYVARAAYEGGTHIGKVGGTDRIRHAHIPYGGKEVAVEQFEVLCVDNSNIHVK